MILRISIMLGALFFGQVQAETSADAIVSGLLREIQSAASARHADWKHISRIEDEIVALNTPLPVDRRSPKVRSVFQRHFTTAKGGSEQPKIGTFGLGPCVGVSFYDSNSKLGAVAHIDALTHLEPSLDAILTQMRREGFQGSWDELQSSVLGGNSPAAIDLLLRIFHFAEKNEITFANRSILQGTNSFFLDTDTGTVAIGYIQSDVDELPLALQFIILAKGMLLYQPLDWDPNRMRTPNPQ